jgi:hypothetical protein
LIDICSRTGIKYFRATLPRLLEQAVRAARPDSERKIRSVARLSSSQTGACQLQVRGEHHVERR